MSPLDRPLSVTLFADLHGANLESSTVSLRKLASRIRTESAEAKSDLPLLKLGRFGTVATPRGSLRSNANMLAFSGLEVDYDGESISVEQAADALAAAGIAAMVYTSPSHTAARPRWRVLCPVSADASPDCRRDLVGRLNAILDGVLSVESFTPSQSFYMGRVGQNPDHTVRLVEGSYIDTMPDPPAPLFLVSASAPPIHIPHHATPDTTAAAALVLACGLFELRGDNGRHQVILSATATVAPFVLSGHLDRGAVVTAIEAACDASGRPPNDGEAADALTGALRTARPYEPPTGGVEFSCEPGRRSMLDRLLSPADCENSPRRGYVIKHLLAPGDVGALIGQPSAGKSVLAPYLAYAVAQGREVFGCRVKQGRALYVAAEDFTGMRQRVAVLRHAHGDAPDFGLVDSGNLRDADARADLLATVTAWKPALVVIDTLGAAFAGMDENAAGDMGDVVALSRRIAASGAAVLLVHHVAKQGDGSPRGHSVLNGTLDVSIRLEPKDEDGRISGSLLKNRSGTTDRALAFRIVGELLGIDDDGEAITAPRAIEVDREARHAEAPKLARVDRGALEVLREMTAAAKQPISERKWRAVCDDRRISASDNPKHRGDVLTRTFTALREKGLVGFGGGNVWLVRAGDEFGAENPPNIPGDKSDKSDLVAIIANGRASNQATTATRPFRAVAKVAAMRENNPDELNDFQRMLH